MLLSSCSCCQTFFTLKFYMSTISLGQRSRIGRGFWRDAVRYKVSTAGYRYKWLDQETDDPLVKINCIQEGVLKRYEGFIYISRALRTPELMIEIHILRIYPSHALNRAMGTVEYLIPLRAMYCQLLVTMVSSVSAMPPGSVNYRAWDGLLFCTDYFWTRYFLEYGWGMEVE